MHTKTAELIPKIEKLYAQGINLAQVSIILGIPESSLSYYRSQRYISRSPLPKRKQSHPLYPTAIGFLERCGSKTETEIAKELGVSRQRIHQIEKRFWVCHLSPDGRDRRKLPPVVCLGCGQLFKRHNVSQKFCSAACLSSYHRVNLTCSNCGKGFTKKKSQDKVKVRRGYDRDFCSWKCWHEHEAKLGTRTDGFKAEFVTLRCTQCGKEFQRQKCNVKQMKIGSFCSQKCWRDYWEMK